MSQGAIFINYRKQDSEWKTETLYKELLKHFDEHTIFKDFTTIEPGDNYRLVIEGALNNCSVLLVVIGSEWGKIKNSSGKRRLDDSSDFVRIEIATALKRGIRVIPVLFDNVDLPAITLPEDIQELSDYQALHVSKVNLKTDVERLSAVIKKSLKPATPEPPPKKDKSPVAAPVKATDVSGAKTTKLSKGDIILIVLISIVLFADTCIYVIYTEAPVNSTMVRSGVKACYLPIALTGLLTGILIFGKQRLPTKTLVTINALSFGVFILWRGLPAVWDGLFATVFWSLLVGGLIASLLILRRQYIATQALLLTIFFGFTLFLFLIAANN